MKHCRKDAWEPECLAKFRAREPEADWDSFRDRARAGDCYDITRAALRAQQGCLCAYCERRLDPDNEQVAHFHPKRDRAAGHNWALDWENLWLACKGGTRWGDQRDGAGDPIYALPQNRSCDEATEDAVLDGIILRPDEVPPFPRLFAFRQWHSELHMEPDEVACREVGIEAHRVRATIERLNLNCRRLAVMRMDVHRELERTKARLRESDYPDPVSALRRLAAMRLGRDEQGCLKAFFTLSRWSLRHHGLAENYLRESGFGGGADPAHPAPDANG
jgi:uncharacterized protein (TIGR02646 family)